MQQLLVEQTHEHSFVCKLTIILQYIQNPGSGRREKQKQRWSRTDIQTAILMNMQCKCTEKLLQKIIPLLPWCLEQLPIIRTELAAETHYELIKPMIAYSFIILELIRGFNK